MVPDHMDCSVYEDLSKHVRHNWMFWLPSGATETCYFVGKLQSGAVVRNQGSGLGCARWLGGMVLLSPQSVTDTLSNRVHL